MIEGGVAGEIRLGDFEEGIDSQVAHEADRVAQRGADGQASKDGYARSQEMRDRVFFMDILFENGADSGMDSRSEGRKGAANDPVHGVGGENALDAEANDGSCGDLITGIFR